MLQRIHVGVWYGLIALVAAGYVAVDQYGAPWDWVSDDLDRPAIQERSELDMLEDCVTTFAAFSFTHTHGTVVSPPKVTDSTRRYVLDSCGGVIAPELIEILLR